MFDNTITYAIRTGVILQDAAGMIDSDQADATWYVQYQSRLQTRARSDERNQQTLQAQIMARLSKVQLAEARHAEAERGYVERQEVIDTGQEQLDRLLAALRAAADGRHGELMAAVRGLSEPAARELLRGFIDEALMELGDLRTDARQAVEAL